MKRKTIKKQPDAKRKKIEPQPYLEDLANNQGLSHLVNHIFGYLEVQDLAKCRIASRSLKNVVDNHKQWWILQLENIRKTPTIFVDYKANGKPSIEGMIEDKVPNWKITNDHFAKHESTERLRTYVTYMLDYFNSRTKSRSSPFLYAVARGHVNFVQLLINTPTDFNQRDVSGYTALRRACHKNHIEILQLLINCSDKKNIDFNAKDNKGHTLFHAACKNANVGAVELIVNQVTSKNIDIFQLAKDKLDIFHFAVCNPDPKVPKYIFEKFKDSFCETKDIDGWSVLHYAIRYGKKETIDYLLASRSKLGIKIDAKTNRGNNALHIACQYNRIDILKSLLKCLEIDKCEVDLHTPNNFGMTPIHYAFKNGNLKTVKFIMNMKADAMAVSHNGTNVLHFAASNPNLNVLKYLLQSCPELIDKTTNTKETLLHSACEKGHLENVKMLFKCSKFKLFDAKETQHGMTPLHFASYFEHEKIVLFMLEQSEQKSIGVQKKDNNGQTAKELAKRRGSTKVLDAFELWKLKDDVKKKNLTIKELEKQFK